MSARFSDLQSDGRRTWYNVVADRYYELQWAAKMYRCRIITRGGVSHVEVPQRRRAEMSWTESETKKIVSGYSRLARDAAMTSDASSDYFNTTRVTDDERVRRAGSTKAIEDVASGVIVREKGGKEDRRIGGDKYINFEPSGGGIQE